MPSLLGGVQSPTTGTKKQDYSRGVVLFFDADDV